MATIRKRKKKDGSFSYTVQVRITRGGQPPYSETRTFPRKAMAEEWAKRRELELAEPGGVLLARWKGVTLDDAIERYQQEYMADAGRTKKATMNALRRFPLARREIAQMLSGDFVDYARMRRESGCSPATINQDVIWIGIVLKTAAAAWNMPTPLDEFEKAKTLMRSKRLIGRAKERDRRPTDEEVMLLRRYFQRSQKIRPTQLIPMEDIMDFAIASARRQAEITQLRWEGLDVATSTCWVRDAKHPRHKMGNHKRFKLTSEAMAIIQRQPRGELIFPYDSKSIGTRWARATAALAIDDLRFHDLRHEGTSRLFERGYDIVEVQQFTLHESWDMLKRYTNLRPERLKLRE